MPTKLLTLPATFSPPRCCELIFPTAWFCRKRISRFLERAIFRRIGPGRSRPQRQKSKVSAFLSDFRDLQVGDYVVHVEHGIGQYQGLKEINQGDGARNSCCSSMPRPRDCTFHLRGLIWSRKYRSSEGAKPALNHLGTAAWRKTKARVRKAMKDMTDELLKLYAQRNAAQGHAFPRRTEWMNEFEDAFEYNETDDPKYAIADVKVTWNHRYPWIASSAAMSDTAKPKSRCVRPSKP